MGILADAGQKIKGKAKQVQGDINQKRGKGAKGGLEKLSGKLDEADADMKLKADKEALKTDTRDTH